MLKCPDEMEAALAMFSFHTQGWGVCKHKIMELC